MLASYRARKAGDLEAARLLAGGHGGPLAQALGRWYDRLDRDRLLLKESQR